MFSGSSIRMQLILSFVFLSILVIGLLLLVTTRSASVVTVNDAKESLILENDERAGIFQITFKDALTAVKTIRETMLVVRNEKDLEMGREKAVNQLMAILRANSDQFDSIFVVWEPDAFDSNDKEQKEEKSYNSHDGRFIPHLQISGGQISVDPVNVKEYLENNKFLTGNMNPNNEFISEPYPYQVGGKTVNYVSFILPIIENGVLLGTCGLDMSLDNFTKMVGEIKIRGLSRSALLSDKGVIVGHTDQSMLNKNFHETERGKYLVPYLYKSLEKKDPQRMADGWTDGSPAYVTAKLITGGNPKVEWLLTTTLPEEKMTESTKALIYSGLKAGAICLVLSVLVGLFAIKFIVGGLTRRIMAVVDNVRQGAISLEEAADSLQSSSHNLANGAQSQAASLEETSSALEEISSMTKSNAQNTLEADSLVKMANEAIGLARNSMAKVTIAMNEISVSGNQISKIVQSINEIAFQTNLLALNAAVEAARAGEAGAGFAVVADEVRNLAIRSAESANSTAALISTTIENITSGSALVEQTESNFKKVEEHCNEVARLVSEVTKASNEQAQGIEQINQAIGQIDSITQENAATSEESASASTELSSQTSSIVETINSLVSIVKGGSSAANHDYAAESKRMANKKAPGSTRF